MLKTTSERRKKLSPEERKRLLKALTYEKVNGKPIYYRNYRKVLKGELPLEAVMGSSGLHAYLITLIVALLLKKLDATKYELLFNEVGFLIKKGSWRNLDIAIFEREKVKPYLLEDKLIPIPPKVVIEVDTKADLSKYCCLEDYAHEKTQDLLNSGVEKVIWIFTKTRKVMIAPKDQKWVVQNWNEPFEVIDGVEVNLSELIKES